MKRIIPIGDRVVVDPIVEEKDKVGDIVLPDSVKRTIPTGKVVAVGKKFDENTHEQIANEVAVGDVVLLPADRLGDVNVTLEDGTEKKYWIFRESDLLGIVTEL